MVFRTIIGGASASSVILGFSIRLNQSHPACWRVRFRIRPESLARFGDAMRTAAGNLLVFSFMPSVGS